MSPASKKTGSDATPVEQAVVRALRDNLERLQRTSNELHEAVADVVAACASSKPTNALPPMLRAQTAAASLSASLEVLTRFVSSTLQSASRVGLDEELLRVVSLPQPEAAPAAPAPEKPAPSIPVPMAAAPQEAPPPATGAGSSSFFVAEPGAEDAAESLIYPEPVVEKAAQFDPAQLPREQQELHRRANRVAKVSMQDIKMLRPEQVRQGRENRDICARLREDIEKARKEYDRRFRPILDHPVDYFRHWMVEILADGDPQALGDYPYPSPVQNR
jgi:hypothetical protein